jgi:predicted GIY-YIG superfamily endonuclease
MHCLDMCSHRDDGQGYEHVHSMSTVTGCVAYLLLSARSTCYIGSTTDMLQRLRQHNGWLSGGAQRTVKHRPWCLVLQVQGFSTYQEAHRFETDWHFPERCFALTSIQRSSYARVPLGRRSLATHVEVLGLIVHTWLVRVPNMIVRFGVLLNDELTLPSPPEHVWSMCTSTLGPTLGALYGIRGLNDLRMHYEGWPISGGIYVPPSVDYPDGRPQTPAHDDDPESVPFTLTSPSDVNSILHPQEIN